MAATHTRSAPAPTTTRHNKPHCTHQHNPRKPLKTHTIHTTRRILLTYLAAYFKGVLATPHVIHGDMLERALVASGMVLPFAGPSDAGGVARFGEAGAGCCVGGANRSGEGGRAALGLRLSVKRPSPTTTTHSQTPPQQNHDNNKHTKTTKQTGVPSNVTPDVICDSASELCRMAAAALLALYVYLNFRRGPNDLPSDDAVLVFTTIGARRR